MTCCGGSKAQVGIGTLIIFIAMILVATVAAGVLLRTSGTLQSKAEATGDETSREVSTAFKVSDIILTCDPATEKVRNISITTSLASGSSELSFNDMMIAYQSGDFYKSGIQYTDASNPTDLAFFTVNFVLGDADGGLNRRDIVEIELDLGSYEIDSNTEFMVSLIPETGTPVKMIKKTPRGLNRRIFVI